MGGWVGTSVGFITAGESRETSSTGSHEWDGGFFPPPAERFSGAEEAILRVFSSTLTPGPSRLGVWVNTVAL